MRLRDVLALTQARFVSPNASPHLEVRAGFAADLIIVDGNPLEDLKTLYPTHQIQLRDGKEVRAGLEWTIAGGVPYHVPTVSARIKQIVDSAKGK